MPMQTKTPKALPLRPAAELLEFARARAATSTWSELHNAVYGVGGKLGELFPTQSARTAFAKCREFKAVADLIGSLRGLSEKEMPSGKFVLRLPASLHAALLVEAKSEGVSLNQLCMAKLATQLQAVTR